MYLIINGAKHTVSRREKKKDQVVYYTVKPMPEEVSGIIEMFRDDGFLMSRDTVADYARQTKCGTVLTLTNRKEVTTAVSTKPSAMEQLRADVDYLAIMTGVEL